MLPGKPFSCSCVLQFSHCRGEKLLSERRSRIPTHPRESGDGMDAAELAASEKKGKLSFQQLGLQASQIRLPYLKEGKEEADDEGGRWDTMLMFCMRGLCA